MRKYFLILILALICTGASAQTKKEIKAAERAERRAYAAEQKRIQDSIWRAEDAARKARIQAENAKKGATSLVIKTIFNERKEVLDLLVHNMMKQGLTPASIDKDYFIVKTEPKMVGSANYETTYTIYTNEGKVFVRAASIAHGSFSVGFGMIRSNTDMVVPVEYGGVEGSLVDVAWKEMEKFLTGIPHTEIHYVLP